VAPSLLWSLAHDGVARGEVAGDHTGRPDAADHCPGFHQSAKFRATNVKNSKPRTFMAKIEDRAPVGSATAPAAPAAGLNDDIGEEMRLRLYRVQFEIREGEQRAYDLFLQNLVKGTSHLSLGQEAVAAGFACAMRPGDLSFCTYRGHAHTLARGVPVEQVLGELMQRDNGLMRGKGGSMHLTSIDHGVMGSYAIIGAHLPIACGAAWRAQYRGDGDVTVCFFGDGTTNIGAFHEALNFAVVWKLPVVFVCENNLYMEYTPIGTVTAVEHPAAGRAPAYGLEPIMVDGQDADAVYRAALNAYEKARVGGGPSLIECKTYRYSGHSRADPAKYRPEGELEKWKKRDPIIIYRERLRQFGVKDDVIADIEADVRRVVDAATEACKAAPPPPMEILTTDVYADGGWAWRN
jgi:acetoin:2,6-dichlorophenolindophenol oxidoreductase subunit alpha